MAACIPGFIKDRRAANSLSLPPDQINPWLASQGLSSGSLISARRSAAGGGRLVHTRAAVSYTLSQPPGLPSWGREGGVNVWHGLRRQREAPLLCRGLRSLQEGVSMR